MSTNLEDFEHQLETHLDPTLSLDPAQADFLAFIDSIINPDTKPTNLMNTINYVASDVAGNLTTAASSSQRSASQPSPSLSSSSFVLPSLLPSSSNSIVGLDESSSLANIAPEQPPSSANNNNTQTSVVVINDRLGSQNEQSTRTTITTTPSQFIDLTKENDDIIILNATTSSRINKSNPSRRMLNRRNSNRSLNRPNTFSNETNDPDSPLVIEILPNPTRPVVLNDSANATIILDDGHDRPVSFSTRANDNLDSGSQNSEIVDESPPKRQRTDAYGQSSSTLVRPTPSTSSSVAPAAPTSNLPQCPICLENLDELKLHGKTLMATHCGHILCNHCLNQTYKSMGNGNAKSILCPTCRTRLTKAKVHSLYL